MNQLDPTQYLPTTTTWWEVLLAILSILAGWIIARYSRRGVLALLRKTPGIQEPVAYVAARIVQYLLVLVGVGLALAFLGANIQPLLAIVVIVVAVFVMVVRGFAENFTASVLIQSRQPVKVGDQIQVEGPDGGIEGTIRELNGRSVIMVTLDGRTVHIPNAVLLGGVLVNHSRQGLRRSEVQVRVLRKAGTSVERVCSLLTAGATRAAGVDTTTPTRALVQAASPERWTLRIQYWHLPLAGPRVTSEVISRLAAELEEAQLDGTVTADPGEPPLVPPDRL
ncbi:mechanosensitive ion channel family protein [Citricoccus sp.]|uniref:mechanosensitive ion channel family protein n=1 Tax=Citricoccus sp. TaxID=1978372 RepID=UPI0028BDAAED|nr:mechanosensitive ion channel family protein [Citricoccus sp.]